MKWLKDKIEYWKEQRNLARQIQPKNFKAMAYEIRDLAVLASQLSPNNKDMSKLIRNILSEMERLADLADRPEFKKLSTGKKLLLRQGLLESKEQLLESIESAPSPTERLQ